MKSAYFIELDSDLGEAESEWQIGDVQPQQDGSRTLL